MKKRQVTLFGNFAKEKTKNYVIYKNPVGNYESFVERYSLRNKNQQKKSDLVKTAQEEWKKISKNGEAQQAYLILREGEKPFVRYDERGFELNKPVSETPVTKTFVIPSSSTRKEPEPDFTIASTLQESPSLPVISLPDVNSLLESSSKASNLFLKKYFLKFCEKFCPGLATEDVINNTSFVQSMSSNSELIIAYMNMYEQYKQNQARIRTDTELYKVNCDVLSRIEELKKKVHEVSRIKIRVKDGLGSMLASGKHKEEMLKDVLSFTVKIKSSIKATDIISKMKKRHVQRVGETKNKLKDAMQANKISLKCLNTETAWFTCQMKAENNAITNVPAPYEPKDILSFANKVYDEFCVPVESLPSPNRESVIDILIEHFPIMQATRQKKSVLIDLRELLIDKDCFIQLLQTETDENNVQIVEKPPRQKMFGPSKKSGRKPLYQKFSSLIDCATDFVKNHSFQAHVRRRETTGTGCGVTLRDIQQHLLKNVPGLKEHGISLDTVHHLTTAPRKNSIRSHRYKKLIDARIPGKRNQYREDSKNQHFLFARVAYREEFVSMFSNEAQFYSSDDMNKLRMGPATAVSRYHQIFRFFMADDAPNYGDHDFPNPGYLLVPSGYMALDSRSYLEPIEEEYVNYELNDLSSDQTVNEDDVTQNDGLVEPAQKSQFIKDKLKREHYKRLVAGPSSITLRACKFNGSSGMTHANDLIPVISQQVKDGKTIAFFKVDNGSDWNLHSLVNNIYMCLLWKDTNLDILGIVSYAAKYSAYNNVEHLWSPMSKKLSSVILPSILEGEDKEPGKQTDLDSSQMKEKK